MTTLSHSLQVVTDASTRTIVAIRLFLNSLVFALSSAKESIDDPGGWCELGGQRKRRERGKEEKRIEEELRNSPAVTVC